jgi:hypothetical protein
MNKDIGAAAGYNSAADSDVQLAAEQQPASAAEGLTSSTDGADEAESRSDGDGPQIGVDKREVGIVYWLWTTCQGQDRFLRVVIPALSAAAYLALGKQVLVDSYDLGHIGHGILR